MKKKIFISLLFVLVVSLVLILVLSFSFIKIDIITNVTKVWDGDTFDLPERRIRLADIEAPNSDDNFTAYEEAKDFLKSLIENKLVYLDVDDYGSTTYDRLVCVAYFRYNSTHLLNVNKELLNKGYAIVWDYANNEFNPSVWTEFAYYPTNIENILQLITNNQFRLLLESLAIILTIIIIISILRVLF
jgi:hypothetical protein